MTRPLRTTPPNFIYHVITRGNNKQQIFINEIDYQYYLQLLIKYKNRYKFLLYHYVLMPNHVHLMIEPTDEGSLSKIMQCINISYVYYFRKKYGGIGHFWQDRFKSMMLYNEQYFLKCESYIELNPVKAGLAKQPEDYRWSSYKTYASGELNQAVTYDRLYLDLADDSFTRRKKYITFIQNMMKEDLNKIKEELYVNREPTP
ncbi:transposase [Candidatus Peregrinibacteria bacterium]|nr:transposase [Candidatus Peregrinibacteria bacterium]